MGEGREDGSWFYPFGFIVQVLRLLFIVLSLSMYLPYLPMVYSIQSSFLPCIYLSGNRGEGRKRTYFWLPLLLSVSSSASPITLQLHFLLVINELEAGMGQGRVRGGRYRYLVFLHGSSGLRVDG
jgi:hypothetical protein